MSWIFTLEKKVKFCPENSLEQQNSRKQNFVLIFLNGILTKLKNWKHTHTHTHNGLRICVLKKKWK